MFTIYSKADQGSITRLLPSLLPFLLDEEIRIYIIELLRTALLSQQTIITLSTSSNSCTSNLITDVANNTLPQRRRLCGVEPLPERKKGISTDSKGKGREERFEIGEKAMIPYFSLFRSKTERLCFNVGSFGSFPHRISREGADMETRVHTQRNIESKERRRGMMQIDEEKEINDGQREREETAHSSQCIWRMVAQKQANTTHSPRFRILHCFVRFSLSFAFFRSSYQIKGALTFFQSRSLKRR